MLDFDSEDIGGMDDDAGDDQEPPPTGRWTATSSHDIYMVDTLKENNDEERKDSSLEKQPKRRRRRRSKSRLGKIHSIVDGTKCSTLQKSTVAVTTQRAVQSTSCCLNSMTRL